VAKVPANPKIYHITHLRNLPQIVEAKKLWSDAKRIELGLQCDVVGISHIKQRRLTEIEVDCHAPTHVGDYVPFYFCPRSVMLFILHKGREPAAPLGL
jgi:ssDNA thymidine ADP-ribosyltransferase, DarT